MAAGLLRILHAIPFAQIAKRAATHRRDEPVGALGRARLLRPHRHSRRDRPKSPACRTSSNTWCSRERRAAPPSMSTSTSTTSAPATTPTPARRTPSSTPPSCRNICRRPWTSSPTSFAPACGKTTSTWRRRSSSKRSSMYEDQPAWWPARTPAASTSPTHPLGNSVLGTSASITALTPRSDARLLFAPLCRHQHHRFGGREFRLERLRAIWSPKPAPVGAGEAGRGNRTEWSGAGGLPRPDSRQACSRNTSCS